MPPASPDSPVGRAVGPVAAAGPARVDSHALETLLVDLGSQIRRGTAHEATENPGATGARLYPTGLTALDALLGGGFPAGRLSEICGPERSMPAAARAGLSAGRTRLAIELIAEALSQGRLTAWIDRADAFDPGSALTALEARGGGESDLDQLLWVRARSEDEALRCCERVMRTEGFEIVVLDLFTLAPEASRRSPRGWIKDVTWLRLARLAAGTRTALIALSETPSSGSRAEIVLEMQARRARFTGPPDLLEALEAHTVLRRHRTRGTSIGVCAPLDDPASPSVRPVPGGRKRRQANPGAEQG